LNRYLFFIQKYEDELRKYYSPNIVRLIVFAEFFPDLFELFLKDDDTTKSITNGFLYGPLSIKGFEETYGVSIAAVYSQLSRMKQLFALVPRQSGPEVTLTEHAWAVYSITRLI
jgi:hypothetical protein